MDEKKLTYHGNILFFIDLDYQCMFLIVNINFFKKNFGYLK